MFLFSAVHPWFPGVILKKLLLIFLECYPFSAIHPWCPFEQIVVIICCLFVCYNQPPIPWDHFFEQIVFDIRLLFVCYPFSAILPGCSFEQIVVIICCLFVCYIVVDIFLYAIHFLPSTPGVLLSEVHFLHEPAGQASNQPNISPSAVFRQIQTQRKRTCTNTKIQTHHQPSSCNQTNTNTNIKTHNPPSALEL